jgi:hypothetical protein
VLNLGYGRIEILSLADLEVCAALA